MGASLRLITVNLFNDETDATDLARLLDHVEPDVVVAQELGPDGAGVIAARYPHHSLHPSLDYLGRGIASGPRAQFGHLPLPHRPGIWARLDGGDRSLFVVGVHLLNPMQFPWWVSVPGRGQQIEALFEWADERPGDEALIIAGDLNASPRWPAYRRMRERWDDLVATWAQSSGLRPESTWGWRPGWPRMLRIDHVFGSGVEAVASSVHAVRGSDHAALAVDLDLG